ncbi:hypothetical protein P9112_000364 [Eukaryota sp. TZLM1-RC]
MLMSESVPDSNGVKRKNDSQQDVQEVLSTSPPQPLLSSFLDKKKLLIKNFWKITMKTKCSKCRQQEHNARTCPNVGKNDVTNSETKCKRKFIRRKESKVEPINDFPQVVAKPVNNRFKHKTCNNCGISFRKNASMFSSTFLQPAVIMSKAFSCNFAIAMRTQPENSSLTTLALTSRTTSLGKAPLRNCCRV